MREFLPVQRARVNCISAVILAYNFLCVIISTKSSDKVRRTTLSSINRLQSCEVWSRPIRQCSNDISFAVCALMEQGVAAIFGPQTPSTSAHVQSICDAMEMPHIETRWDYRLKRDDYSVNVHPHPSSLSKVRHTTDQSADSQWPRIHEQKKSKV